MGLRGSSLHETVEKNGSVKCNSMKLAVSFAHFLSFLKRGAPIIMQKLIIKIFTNWVVSFNISYILQLSVWVSFLPVPSIFLDVGMIEPSVVWEEQITDKRFEVPTRGNIGLSAWRLTGLGGGMYSTGHWLFWLCLPAFPRCCVASGWRNFSSNWLLIKSSFSSVHLRRRVDGHFVRFSSGHGV